MLFISEGTNYSKTFWHLFSMVQLKIWLFSFQSPVRGPVWLICRVSSCFPDITTLFSLCSTPGTSLLSSWTFTLSGSFLRQSLCLASYQCIPRTCRNGMAHCPSADGTHYYPGSCLQSVEVPLNWMPVPVSVLQHLDRKHCSTVLPLLQACLMQQVPSSSLCTVAC
jgi:hypothetical protein